MTRNLWQATWGWIVCFGGTILTVATVPKPDSEPWVLEGPDRRGRRIREGGMVRQSAFGSWFRWLS